MGKSSFGIMLAFVLWLVSGCSSYQATSLQDILRPAHTAPHYRNKAGLYLVAWDYSQPALSQLYLGRNLLEKKLVTILLEAENLGEGTFVVQNRKNRIRLVLEDGSSLFPMKIEQVIEKIGGGWELSQDYRKKYFRSSILQKGDRAHGFLFFPAPTKSLPLDHLEVKAVRRGKTEKEYAQELIFNLPIPAPD